MNRISRMLSAGAKTSVPVGVAALTMFAERPSGGQVVYDWRPYHDCVVSGKCLASNTVCAGPAVAGKPCRFCGNPLTISECEFSIFQNCYELVLTPSSFDCGQMYVGVCSPTGMFCVSGVANGRTCPRPDCY